MGVAIRVLIFRVVANASNRTVVASLKIMVSSALRRSKTPTRHLNIEHFVIIETVGWPSPETSEIEGPQQRASARLVLARERLNDAAIVVKIIIA